MVTTTWSYVGRLAMLLFVVSFVSVEFTLANKQCKGTIMHVVMKQCSDPGMRSRRHARDLGTTINPLLDADIVSHADRTVPKRQFASDPDSSIYNSQVYKEAGQLTSSRLSQRTQPIPTIIRRNRAAQYSMAVAAPFYYESRFDLRPIFDTSRPYQQDSRLTRETLPDESSDDLGFDLTAEEMDELYNEILDRFPRRSQRGRDSEEAKKVFLEAAARCCQNEEKCLKEKNIMSCI